MRHALSTHGVTTAMKLVCVGERQQVVGIHLIGDNVDEMLQGFAVALGTETKQDCDTVAIHRSCGGTGDHEDTGAQTAYASLPLTAVPNGRRPADYPGRPSLHYAGRPDSDMSLRCPLRAGGCCVRRE